MKLKASASLQDYINSPSLPNSHTLLPPSYNDQFESLELEQYKILIRQSQLQKLVLDLQKLLKLIYNKTYNKDKQDKILIKLKNLKQEALQLNFKSIADLVHLAIGKRIAVLEIRKQTFDDKKMVCQFDLRYIKLRNIKFNELQIEKLEEKTFIFEPFVNGSGFNYQSCLYKNFHAQTLTTVEAKNTLHQINTIWYRSYTRHKEPKFGILQQWMKFLAKVAITFMGIIAFIAYYVLEVPLEPSDDDFMAWLIKSMGILAPITVLMLLICTIMDACHPIKDETQIRIISQAIKQYITNLNEVSENSTFKRSWRVQVDLLWIQLKIISSMVEDETIADPILTMCTQKILNNKIGHTKSFLMNVRGSHLVKQNN